MKAGQLAADRPFFFPAANEFPIVLPFALQEFIQ
jgi:hypothetical protein